MNLYIYIYKNPKKNSRIIRPFLFLVLGIHKLSIVNRSRRFEGQDQMNWGLLLADNPVAEFSNTKPLRIPRQCVAQVPYRAHVSTPCPPRISINIHDLA